MNKFKNFLIVSLLVVVAVLSILLLKDRQKLSFERRVVYDTVRVLVPKAKDSTVISYINVKLPIVANEEVLDIKDPLDLDLQITDSAFVPMDSVDVTVPIMQKVYRDSLYTAYISGYNARLDSLILNTQTTYIQPIKKKEKRWSIGPAVGVNYNGDIVVGIVLTYGLIRF